MADVRIGPGQLGRDLDHATPDGEFTEEWVRQKAHRLYVEAEAQMDIEPGHTALLVIDMTDEFVKPHWSPYWVPAR